MTIALPAVIVFGLATWLLVHSRQVGALELVIVGLFGFFLAATGLGHELGVFLDSLFGLDHGGAVPPPAVPTSGRGIPL